MAESVAAPPPRGPAAPLRILIAGGGTGGHLMPALAIADALREHAPQVEPVLIGAVRGVEARILPTRDFRFHLLPSEPIYRRTWWRNFRWPFVAGRLLRAVSRVFETERPAVVLGTGGYASGPVVWWGARRDIPAAIQEQNAYPGLATRWLSRRVRHVYLGLPEARRLLRFGPNTEVFDTGNPISPPSPGRRSSARGRFGLDGTRPVLLVTGGSQGALAINRAVAGWLDAGGPGQAQLIWVTGRGTYDEFSPYDRPPTVRVIDFLDPMADAYSVADLVVSRAGMITVAELCAWGLPNVLIPLPTAAADHQTHNAQVLAAAGASVVLLQSELTPERLGDVVSGLLSDPVRRKQMIERALARGRPHSALDIVSKLLTLIG
ncbi:MAG TPA: UDP-N-acetylglucosamine--N-acetylmuramyl-(pentapeptide) pyrophosphoryl-undecaprenol N-acetylglucosamine transferase [Gemmatimonadales bacterium]|nr:UDP-N-acetylglucosamine--N-acetylmuramyl-(pentapeptide) pyrophosphoryl-undecaprenol N-acetylglucosamine transferase [Gemmatimonadales bacterium]